MLQIKYEFWNTIFQSCFLDLMQEIWRNFCQKEGGVYNLHITGFQ